MDVQEKKEEVILENEEEKNQEIQSVEEERSFSEEIDVESENNSKPKKDKNIYPILLAFVILIILTFVGFISYEMYRYYNPQTISITNISISLTKNTIDIDTSIKIETIIEPANHTPTSLQWFSSNPEVITVENGVITAFTEGESTIYAINDTGIKSNEITVYSTLSSGYYATKSVYIPNVPYINQFTLGYPTGCEAVSATMVANYLGYNISSAQVIAATPTDEKGIRQETHTVEVTVEQVNEESGETETITTTEEQTDWYGGNPFEVFVGHPSKKLNEGSYGCFAKPITVALQSCGVPATNISGCSIDTVFEYIRNGKPVVVWCKKNAGDLIEGVTWKYEDGSGSYTELKGEHCAVLIGYDSEYVYLNDPSAGKGVKQPKSKFISNWHILFNQAIVID